MMNLTQKASITTKPVHPWLRNIGLAAVPGPTTPLLDEVMQGIAHHARRLGHAVQTTPDAHSDVILATARFGDVLSWREGLLFSARRRFNLSHNPTVYTLVHIPSAAFQSMLGHFAAALARDVPNPDDYVFPGLAPRASRVLYEQGRRGGPMLSLLRLVQAQAKCIRILLLVGDERPLAVYHFDLAGAYPQSHATDPEAFYEDIVLRIVTTVSTNEVTQHQVVGDPIPQTLWRQLGAPAAMREAGQQLDRRHFFTEMLRIADLVQVPVVAHAVASQYSEGCFATWEPRLGALISTITGSARPVDKGNITDDDLAVIVGVRPDGNGALVRPVEALRNAPPSSEAVEMRELDEALPSVEPRAAQGASGPLPAARSKLHGHRGIEAYDPRHVEYVTLDAPYYHYLVSCATEAQARGIQAAFARSEALQNPKDPRQVVFTVLPGHGAVIVEKWVEGKVPFQVMWEYMDAGYLRVASLIPQGEMRYVPDPGGRMVLQVD